VVAVEPDRAMIRTAHKRAPHARFAVARVEHLPFRHESFGTVVASLVFCSVRDPERGLREIRRVLAPGGELRMMEHVRSSRRWVAKIQDLVQPAWTAVTGGCHPNRDTEETVRRAGFAIDPATRRARGHLRLFSAR
jgi:ubiquinone/menaquinone biosynthesis C-methylase UbiE